MCRCTVCNKRLGLTGFDCKCGGTFCAAHRLSFDHACAFDHAARDIEKLSTAMPRIVADKVTRL